MSRYIRRAEAVTAMITVRVGFVNFAGLPSSQMFCVVAVQERLPVRGSRTKHHLIAPAEHQYHSLKLLHPVLSRYSKLDLDYMSIYIDVHGIYHVSMKMKMK